MTEDELKDRARKLLAVSENPFSSPERIKNLAISFRLGAIDIDVSAAYEIHLQISPSIDAHYVDEFIDFVRLASPVGLAVIVNTDISIEPTGRVSLNTAREQFPACQRDGLFHFCVKALSCRIKIINNFYRRDDDK